MMLSQRMNMKKYTYTLLVILAAGCGTATQKSNEPLLGAYNMLSQTFTGDVLDTTFTQHKELKIYTGGYMMYVQLNPADSSSAFGIGTYTFDTGRLVETIVYSANGVAENTNHFSDTITVKKTAHGYRFIVPDIKSDKGKIGIIEEYATVGDTVASPIDGCWKQVAGYSVTKKDTVRWADVQYKTFYAGHFAFGNVDTNPGHAKQTGISYGTFVMNGSTVTETITASTWASLNGQTFTVDITMNGKDSFTQTIVQKNGVKEVLTYERLKSTGQ